MATTTTLPSPTPGTSRPAEITVAEAERALAVEQAAFAWLDATARGIGTRRREVRRQLETYVTATGKRAQREVDVEVVIDEPVDALARLQAKRALPAAELRVLEAEAALETARQRAGVAERARQAALRAEGEALLAERCPG